MSEECSITDFGFRGRCSRIFRGTPETWPHLCVFSGLLPHDLCHRWDSSHWLLAQKYIIFFAAKNGEALYSQQQKADCGSDHELLIAKFRLKLRKVGKTIRPFRYDLNQIPYDYTVEVRNRCKGLDMIDRVPDELWMEVRNIVQDGVTKAIPKKEI